LKVFWTVGDAVAVAVKERDRPVVDRPKVRGSDVVWRVSLGREEMLWSLRVPLVVGGSCRQDMADESKEEGVIERADAWRGERVKSQE
jgi:hypothetical protein